MEMTTSNTLRSMLLWTAVAALLSQNMAIPVMSALNFEDQKNYYTPDPNAGPPPLVPSPPPPRGHATPIPPYHGAPPYHGTPPSPSHGDGSHGHAPPTNCGNPPSTGGGGGGRHRPTPSPPTGRGSGTTPSPSPPTGGGGGGGYYRPPPTPTTPTPTPTTPTPVIVTPPTVVTPPTTPIEPGTPTYPGISPPTTPIDPGTPTYPGISPPTTPIDPGTPTYPGISPPTIPIITPGTPTIPGITFPPPPFSFDPNSPPFTCTYWSNHPTLIWGLFGWWGTVGSALGASSLPGFGANMNLLQALSNPRTDGLGELYREGTAALLNSMAPHTSFPYTTSQVRDSFVAALTSNKAAAAQARLFKRANEGRTKP